jgi:hypothetical protein
MPTRVLALTQDTGASEDYNLNYTFYLSVSSDTLDFSQDVFTKGEFRGDRESLKKSLRALGYEVDDLRVTIVELEDDEDFDDEDEDEEEDEE